MDQVIETLEAQTMYHIKGDVICSCYMLCPEANYEMIGGQWGRELSENTGIAKTIQTTLLPTRNVFHSRAQFFNVKQEEDETLDGYWERSADIVGLRSQSDHARRNHI